MNPRQIVIYSHGFGVRKDDRGLFADIAAGLPKVEHVMFDYNQVNDRTDDLTVVPLNEQAEKLRQVIEKTHTDNPDAIIGLICHSQGCVVTAMSQPQGIHKTIFLAPPDHFVSIDQKIKKMSERPGAKIHEDGSMSYPRRDDSTTIIPKSYWDSRRSVDTMSLYHELAQQTELIVIQADQDEVIDTTDFSSLTEARIIHMNTGHDFESKSRAELLIVIKQELGQ
jgi:hypothetical protein